MFRASDIFGRRAGASPAKPTVETKADPEPPQKRGLGTATTNRIWDPATGRFYEEEVPEDIQALMGGGKWAKVEQHQDSRQAWGGGGAASQRRTAPKAIGPSTVGLGGRAGATAANPSKPSEKLAPSVEYSGFSKVDLDDRYYERKEVVVNEHPTYWSNSGDFFIYWQGEVQRWAICDAASFAAVRAGQLPGWAYKEDHKHLCLANGWMEAWNGEWRTPHLQAIYRSSSQHALQWEDPLLQKSVTTIAYKGFTMSELDNTYILKPSEVIQGRPSYWDTSGVYFIYWQAQTCRWAICDLKCLAAVRDGQCPGWAYRSDSCHFANAKGWMEMRNNDWVEAGIETSMISACTKGLKIQLNGFSRPDLNTLFTEKPDQEIQGKPTHWDPSDTFFMYWQESMRRWAICDKVSEKLAQSGLAPGWAYLKDSQHFARASGWMEAWGKDWVEATVRCTILEGVVKEAHQSVKAELKEGSGPKLSTNAYRALVKRVYEIRKPDKLATLDQLLKKYAGRESELFRQVCEKYDVDADELAAEMPQTSLSRERQPPQPESQAALAQEAGAADYAELEHVELPQLKASEYAVLVQSVYEQFMPKKLQDLPRLLKKYKAKERDLYLEVCKKYGAHPTKFHARHRDGGKEAEEEEGEGENMAEPV